MSDLTKPPPFDYIAHIDEAGDPGIRRVRPIDDPGGSEWFVLGCSLIQANRSGEQPEWIRTILDSIGLSKSHGLHYRELVEWRKPLVCSAIAEYPVRLFAVVSNKKNMKGYNNIRAASKSEGIPIDQVFYNWCVRLILERVTDYCYRRSMRHHGEPRNVKVLLSERGTHGYARAIWYSQMLKDQGQRGTTFLNKRTINWRVFDTRLIEIIPHQLNAGLQIADVVASSFYQAVDVLPPTNWNSQNARWLKPRLAQEDSRFENYGLMFLPFKYYEAALLPQQIDVFEHYGFQRYRFQRR
jgi:hypothetical protein